MDAFEQDPTAALAHVCLTTGIHVPGLNNLRRLSNGTCPEEGEQVAIDEAEKTLEALAASVSGAASHAADAYRQMLPPHRKVALLCFMRSETGRATRRVQELSVELIESPGL